MHKITWRQHQVMPCAPSAPPEVRWPWTQVSHSPACVHLPGFHLRWHLLWATYRAPPTRPPHSRRAACRTFTMRRETFARLAPTGVANSELTRLLSPYPTPTQDLSKLAVMANDFKKGNSSALIEQSVCSDRVLLRVVLAKIATLFYCSVYTS